MTSITDVAREAKVSLSTVSRVCNRVGHVNPQMRQRVEEVVRRLGYRPRTHRGQTAAAGVRRLAFVYAAQTTGCEQLSSYCRELIAGVQADLGESYTLNILPGAEHVDKDAMFRQHLEAREFDGVLIFGSERAHGYIPRVQQAGVPLVVFNRVSDSGRFASVSADFFGGAVQVLTHMAQLGHRRLAHCFIEGAKETSGATRQIGRGLASVTAVPCQVVEIEMPEAEALKDARPFCERALAQGATAFLAADRLALGLIQALEQMGRRVPEDVSVVGTDDLGLKTLRGQQLTSLGYDKRRMGQMAVQILQQMIQAQGQLRWMTAGVSTFLREGQTCDRVGS